MKAKILAVILTTCVLFLNVFPPVVSASEPDIVVDSGELEIVVDISEPEIVVDISEPEVAVDGNELELIPVAAAYCPGSSTNTSGSFAGYRYSYSSNTYIKYRLQHPDGRTIDIMSETSQSVALARDYMSVIEAMKHADANAEAISEMLGWGVSILDSIVRKDITAAVFKNMPQKTAEDWVVRQIFKDSLGTVTDAIIKEIIEAIMPDLCDIQELMKDADNIYDDLWDMVSNN